MGRIPSVLLTSLVPANSKGISKVPTVKFQTGVRISRSLLSNRDQFERKTVSNDNDGLQF